MLHYDSLIAIYWPERRYWIERFGLKKIFIFFQISSLHANKIRYIRNSNWRTLLDIWVCILQGWGYLAFSSPSAPNPVFFCADFQPFAFNNSKRQILQSALNKRRICLRKTAVFMLHADSDEAETPKPIDNKCDVGRDESESAA